MPKMKTHRGAAKRFRTTGSGKIMRKREGTSHLRRRQSKSNKRRLNIPVEVTGANAQKVRQLIGD
jgi:large subunit ribosomal protein L35